MNEIADFFKKLLDTSDWPPRWHCGKWSDFHGWLYIISDLLIWAAYFAIPVAIIKYISKKQDAKFIRLYFLFAAFILACGATHFLDAIAFWIPAYRLNALVRFITAVVSWLTVFQLLKYLPEAFSLKSKQSLQVEIDHRHKAEDELRRLNATLEQRVHERTAELQNTLREISAYKFALDESAIVAITNQKGIITHVNDNFCRISKYSREELLGQDHRIINSGYHSKEYIRDLWVTIANGKIWKGELKNKAKDGTFYWVDTTIVPFLNEQGKPYQYVAIRADITERKKAEEKILSLNLSLEKSEKQFRAMIEHSKDVFVVSSEQGVSFVSPGIKQMLGYTEEEFKTLTPEELMHPSDLPLRWNELANPGDMIDLEFRSRHKNGEWRWLEGTGVNLKDIEGLNGIVFTLRDVTERKISEQRLAESERIYKTIASSIPGSIICLIDKEYRYLLVEGDMLEKTGYIAHNLLGNKAEDVLPEKRFQELLPNFKRVLNGEYFITETSRAGFELATRYVPLRADDGEVYAAMIVAIDITRLKQVQRQLEQLNLTLEKKVEERTAQLETANKELEAFSYSVSHDLRAPLRAVSGFAKMLEEDYEQLIDDNGKRLLTTIQQNSRQMGMLIDDLLEFSRLGRKEPQKSRIDMNAMIASVIQEAKVSNKYHANIIVDHLLPAYGDTALIKQVLVNLVSNAFKYSSKKESPQVNITSFKKDDQVVFAVKDNGDGFDMQYQQKLFKVFERLHNSDEFEGTGVGLAIAKRIIEKHGGRIWAHAVKGEGASFYISLPDKEVQQP
ncbi:PAS domain-containing sensor histidine kinase [Foetidibacter luteolus]|uniref:PAS domain-containing sensor histidine kinase n=1 Tax=Foetidibacter luteolus TaxID=2608880 RepID=UPI00129A3F73|nr:PAS domain S-box protein [Foetidibacter luteolus]